MRPPVLQIDEPLYVWLQRAVRRSWGAYGRYRQRRATACSRCGRLASSVCAACRALICDDCSVTSIETGVPATLCLDCGGFGSERRPASALRTDPGKTFRRGVAVLLVALVTSVLVSFRQSGWSSYWRMLSFLLQPAILMALVPLAYLLGAIATALLNALRRRIERF